MGSGEDDYMIYNLGGHSSLWGLLLGRGCRLDSEVIQSPFLGKVWPEAMFTVNSGLLLFQSLGNLVAGCIGGVAGLTPHLT